MAFFEVGRQRDATLDDMAARNLGCDDQPIALNSGLPVPHRRIGGVNVGGAQGSRPQFKLVIHCRIVAGMFPTGSALPDTLIRDSHYLCDHDVLDFLEAAIDRLIDGGRIGWVSNSAAV
ncbi:hypothetical protein G3545_13935 [Starkeya sp. ORNL1]|uniref:hypothetical protein n=1 Tax=Starkeya sp. ORNL1 TaxID=2709380 RepID=UPI001463D944|nr:hypothetical protein [Starkeya sp. ORNL1]QJP14643.1 hypothetical protein G3545_13935 [Starkeya sp. ORNL1]